MAALSLFGLLIVIVLACWKKWNAGILSIAMCLILCQITGLSTSSVISKFNGTLFLQLAFSTSTFAVFTHTGTAQLILKKLLKITGKRVIPIMPLFFMAMMFIPGYLGLGSVLSNPLMAFGAIVGVQLGINPVLIPIMVLYGKNSTLMHPAHMGGIIVKNIATETDFGVGAEQVIRSVWNADIVMSVIMALVFYVVLKGYKINPNVQLDLDADLPALSKKDWLTILGLAFMIIGLTIFSWDLAAIGALTLVFYILTGVITEKEAFAIMPMSVIFLITGTGVLISMIVTLGGFDLIMSALEPMLNSVTAAPIVTAIAGMLSWVSSAVGVVIPTMTPMAPGIAAQVGGVSSVAIASAVSCGSHMAALSPFSGGGGYVMSFTSPHVTEHERKKMIPTLLVAAFSSLVMGSLMGLVGFYNLF